MKPSLLQKLAQMAERRSEIERDLGQPSVAANQDVFRRLSQEYAQLGPLSEAYAAHVAASKEQADLLAMRAEPDKELRDMADSELPGVTARIEALEATLQGYLVPSDPLDGNNVFLEIRAGTGGDEAAIFAGDLFRMYSRYAETRGWGIEVLRANDGEHGG